MKKQKEILKNLRIGIRLNTKAPKIEIPKNVYNRKLKHKDKIDA